MKTVGIEAMRRHVEQLTATIQTLPVKQLHQARGNKGPRRRGARALACAGSFRTELRGGIA